MKCPRCGREIYSLACIPCTALQSRQAVLDRQPAHLPDVRAGRLNFFATRLSGKHPWHLMLFGDRAHAYCGAELLQPGKDNRRDIPYAQLAGFAEVRMLCPKCRAALAAIEESAREDS